jgi:DNA-binding HxlR family transcriptional regulator
MNESECKSQLCPIKEVMDFLGQKWTLIILYNLDKVDVMRFNELSENLKISPRTLTKRLVELESKKLVNKKRFNTIPPRVDYSLTEKGKGLVNSFTQLNQWALENFHN